MKKTVLTCSLFLGLSAFPFLAKASTVGDYYALRAETKQDVVVRTGKSWSSSALGTLKAGMKPPIYSVSKEGWGEISYFGRAAYIPMGYATYINPDSFEDNKSYYVYNPSIMYMYNDRSPEGKTGAAIGKQAVSSTHRYGQWFEIDSYAGKKWLNTADAEAIVIPVEEVQGTIEAYEITYLHNYPFDAYKTNAGIGPQTLTYTAKSGNWYKIKSYAGDKWVYYKPSLYARTTMYTVITDEKGSDITYIGTGYPVEVTKVLNDKYEIQIDGVKGFIPKNNATLYSLNQDNTAPYFIKKGTDLYHAFWSGSGYAEYQVGKAPDTLPVSKKMYTFDTTKVNGSNYYSYFDFLSVRSKSNITAEQIDNYFRVNKPGSPLIGTGKDFVEIANKYNVNAMYLVAHAIQESGWGTSKIAQDKKNLFGIGAVDSDPYRGAYTFNSFKDCIEFLAGTFLPGGKYSFIDANGIPKETTYDAYVYSNSWKYKNGSILGNKNAGMNIKYASDPYWGTQIAGLMYRLDKFAGGTENKKYALGVANSGSTLYTYNPTAGGAVTKLTTLSKERYLTINRTVWTPTGNMYEVFSDEKGYEFNYIYPSSVTLFPTF